MEPQLELDLVEGKCALDAEDVTITLFNFNELDSKSNSISTGYRLSDTIQVGRRPLYYKELMHSDPGVPLVAALGRVPAAAALKRMRMGGQQQASHQSGGASYMGSVVSVVRHSRGLSQSRRC